MKAKILLLIGIFILLLSPLTIMGEMSMWNNVITDKPNQIVNYHGYYQFEDTTAQMSSANVPINLYLWYEVQPLPLVLNGSFGEVDYCNLTIQHYKNIFDDLGNILNTTTEIQTYGFANSSLNSTIIVISAKNKDSIIADMKCHYTDVRGLYYGNILAGRFTIYMSSYQCSECTQYSLEELSNQAQLNLNMTGNELSIYDKIQQVAIWDFQAWLIVSWIIKIGLIFVAIGLIFAGVYYFYIFIKDLGKGLN